MRLFSFGKLFLVTCSCWFFLELFLEMIREKRGGKGRRGEDAQSESIELCCSQRTKNHHKFKSFQ